MAFPNAPVPRADAFGGVGVGGKCESELSPGKLRLLCGQILPSIITS